MGRIRGALAILIVWTVPAVLSSSLILVRQRGPGDRQEWWPTLIGQLPSWWLWALLTPLVLLLARKIIVAGPSMWKPLLFHATIGVVVVALYVTLEAPFAIHREGRALTPESWIGAIGGGLSFQFITNYLIYFALVGVGHAMSTSRALRARDLQASRLETQLADSRLDALKAQLQPHFLFNTLHTIGGLVREGESDRAVRMISGLSGLLRHTLDQVKSPELPLHAELEALERYVEIEEVRFEDRLQVERAIDPDVADTNVPALLLQPLVENAIRHGVERRADAGLVRIEAVRDGSSLLLRVTDDGIGLPEHFDLEQDEGVGLGSTRRRLAELYGHEGTISVRRIEPYGTEVTVRLPLRATP